MTAVAPLGLEYLDSQSSTGVLLNRYFDKCERWGEQPEPIVPAVRDPTDYSGTHELVDDTTGRKLGWEFVGRNYETWEPIHKPVWPQRCKWCGCSATEATGHACDAGNQRVNRFCERFDNWVTMGCPLNGG